MNATDDEEFIENATGGGKSGAAAAMLAEAELAGFTPLVVTDTRSLKDFEALAVFEDEMRQDEMRGLLAGEAEREQLAGPDQR